ncbi:hypothetical protein N7G274_005638 [Stereocaulon virgatum]|uniref:Uncharacterized protein n=1 Tax=Stereocaulon virgatum TaxID=373712 RepID=A0ABR4A9U8_9LECA
MQSRNALARRATTIGCTTKPTLPEKLASTTPTCVAKAGFKVTVFEKNDSTGGKCSLIHHDGYTILPLSVLVAAALKRYSMDHESWKARRSMQAEEQVRFGRASTYWHYVGNDTSEWEGLVLGEVCNEDTAS